MLGAVVLAGGAAVTEAVGAETPVSLPATLVAVTSTRTLPPMSAGVRS